MAGSPKRSLVLALVLAAVVPCLFSASALAENCTRDSTNEGGPSPQVGAASSLFDSQGYEWDTTATPDTRSHDQAFASLFDGGSGGPAFDPPGVVANNDSYDRWGGLFVGSDASLGNMYFSSDNGSCELDLSGQELVFPEVSVHGLLVQRKLFVSSAGLPGARLLEFVTNPGPSPVTTSVQVGDTRPGLDDLGSDSRTGVRFSSNGDTKIDRTDKWVVTSDDGGLPTNTDFALAHVFDGPGGADSIDFATLEDTSHNIDHLAYRWNSVTVQPGQTAAFLSYEIQQAEPDRNAAHENADAMRAALAYESAPPTTIYAGMSVAEIAAVRNWPKPAPPVSIAAVSGATDAAPVSLTAVPGSGFCSSLSGVNWDFGDGGTASGLNVSHAFSAGGHTVKLTATSTCGGTGSATVSFNVADVTRPRARTLLHKRSSLSRLLSGKLVETLTSSEAGDVSVLGTIPAAFARKATRARIARTVIRRHATLRANVLARLSLKPSHKAAKGLRRLRSKLTAAQRRRGMTLTITSTIRDAARNARRVKTTVKVTF